MPRKKKTEETTSIVETPKKEIKTTRYGAEALKAVTDAVNRLSDKLDDLK